MLKEMNKDEVKVVYGFKRLMKNNVQYSGLSFYLEGLSLNILVNLLYGTKSTDEPTCYKMFDSKLLKSINLQTEKFEFCPEVTAKVTKRILEFLAYKMKIILVEEIKDHRNYYGRKEINKLAKVSDFKTKDYKL